jgi:hypothetical protein
MIECRLAAANPQTLSIGPRNLLIANMRDEARQNLKSAQRAFDSYFARATWLRESVDVARRATSSDGVFNVPLPAAASFPGATAPLLPTWSVASSNNSKQDPHAWRARGERIDISPAVNVSQKNRGRSRPQSHRMRSQIGACFGSSPL